MRIKKSIGKYAISLILVIVMSLGGMLLVGCSGKRNDDNGDNDNKKYDNENTPLVFSSQEVDKVFSPFFSTSAADGNVVDLTQIGMIGNDKNGGYTYGPDEDVVTENLGIVRDDATDTTTYYFVMKNNVRYPNGSYVTIKDVLFNYYVYLDPVYSGSSTIYSTDIVGLKEYRTQSNREQEQDGFTEQFKTAAQNRINSLVKAYNDIDRDLKKSGGSVGNLEIAEFRQKLTEYKATNTDKAYANIDADFDKAVEFFNEELESDWNNCVGTYSEQEFYYYTDKINKVKAKSDKKLSSDVEMFLYTEGFITWNAEDNDFEWALGEEITKNMSKEAAINAVREANMPGKLNEVVYYWATTSTKLAEFIANDEMEKYFAGEGSSREYKSISGIKFANMDAPVTFTDKSGKSVTYAVPTYADANRNQVVSGNEVLSITINGVDPKAIWNFSITVSPMYYYSDAEHIKAFDYKENFGVEYGSQTFMNEVVKASNKIGVPVGAGPYAASKSSGGIADGENNDVQLGDFYNNGVIYFERNPYYNMGKGENGVAKIKKVRYQVVAAARMLDSLYNNEIDFAEPNAKPETIQELGEKGMGNKTVETSGYGYIGINAGKVPSIYVRRAIMYCIDTRLCIEYYKTMATPIYRSMSKANWAYPEDCTPYYPYIGGPVPANLDVVDPDYKAFVQAHGLSAGQTPTASQQEAFIKELVETGGYTLGADGVYQKSGSGKADKLKYTFTIAGDSDDHPAFSALNQARTTLNKYGFDITVTKDANALSKLSSGALTVWAAAWGSTIDPDMYQVYHKDSKATSVLNWGYKQILNDTTEKYMTERDLINELSELIDKARKTETQSVRKRDYKEALDIVMELAVELPTYQRSDLYAYNQNKIDASTFTPDGELSPYKGLTSRIADISLM